MSAASETIVEGARVTLQGGVGCSHEPGRVEYVGPTGRVLVIWADGCSAVYPRRYLVRLPDAAE